MQAKFGFRQKSLIGLLCLLLVVLNTPYQAAAKDPVSKSTPPAVSSPYQLVPPPPATAPSVPLLQSLPPAKEDLPPVSSYQEPVRQFDPNVSPEYVIGPGDQLLMQDFSTGELNEPYQPLPLPVLPDGTVMIHPIGQIQAAGLTMEQINKLVNDKASKYIIKPDITISIYKTRPSMVYVLGEVVNPGLYTNEASTTDEKASTAVAQSAAVTVTSALQRAGGLKETADVRQIRVTRLSNKEPKVVNLWSLLVEGDTTQDIGIQSGDVIYVPRGGSDYNPDALGLAANQHRRVRIWGAVNLPGLLDMHPDDDIYSVIARAGGFTRTAVTRWVLLSRLNRDGTVISRKISVKRGLHDSFAIAREHIKPGDVIVVADSMPKRAAMATYNASLALLVGSALIAVNYYFNKKLLQSSGGAVGDPAFASTSPGVISLPAGSP